MDPNKGLRKELQHVLLTLETCLSVGSQACRDALFNFSFLREEGDSETIARIQALELTLNEAYARIAAIRQELRERKDQ